MSVVRWILAGFGWEIGKTAAQETVKALREDAPQPATETPEKRAERERQDQKRAEQARKQREKEAKRAEQEIARELAALKKRVK